jgi:putative ABC transport system permease protein
MDLLETLNISMTAIMANRMRSFLTMLGIVIGVMSVILLISLVSGLKSYITSQIEGLGSNLVFVIPGRLGGSRSPGGIQANKLNFQYATELKNQLNNEAEVSGAVQKNTTIKFGNKSDKGVSVTGVEPNYPKIVTGMKMSEGRFFNNSEAQSGKRVAVIGPTVQQQLFPNKPAVGAEIDVSGLKYRVIGITTKRGSTFGVDFDNSIYVPILTAQRQFGLDKLNTIYISVNNADNVATIQEKATKVLNKHLTEDDFTVQTQESALSTISQITGVLTLALGGIAAISLLVGGIGIMNIMLVSVTERTREIGLRKALGARPSDIRNQFLIEAMTLSGIGGITGIILGILISLIINNFFQTQIPLWSVALSFGFSMIVGIVFGVAPAIRAARLNPIQALRYE